jgi:membrane protein
MASNAMTDSNLSTEEQIESLWKLGGLRATQLGKRVWKSINEDNLLGRASELAYNFILSLFPLLLFLVSLFGLFASRGSQLQGKLLFYMSRVLPPSAFDLLSKTISEVTHNTGSGKLTLGIVLALFTASGGVAAMMSALDGAYSVRDSRSWFKVRGIALVLTIALAVLVLTALILVLAGGAAASYFGARLGLGIVAVVSWKVIQFVAAFFFVILAFSLIYYYGPDLEEQHWYWITPGSLIGVLLWFAASVGFRVYLHFFNTYSKTYGSLGAAIILLIWFYVTGLAFLVGGCINAEIETAAAEHGHPEAKAAGEKAPGQPDPAPAKKVA